MASAATSATASQSSPVMNGINISDAGDDGNFIGNIANAGAITAFGGTEGYGIHVIGVAAGGRRLLPPASATAARFSHMTPACISMRSASPPFPAASPIAVRFPPERRRRVHRRCRRRRYFLRRHHRYCGHRGVRLRHYIDDVGTGLFRRYQRRRHDFGDGKFTATVSTSPTLPATARSPVAS